MRAKLKELRTKHKMTQEEVAKKLCISRAFYTNIELGRKNPSFELVLKIKNLFKTQKDDIFFNADVSERHNGER